MKLYDTKRRELVEITPLSPGVLKIYACGPTVYRDAHVGNMRTSLLTDLIKRFAEYQGLKVELIQNITDVGHMADDTGLGGVDEVKLTLKIESLPNLKLNLATHYQLLENMKIIFIEI